MTFINVPHSWSRETQSQANGDTSYRVAYMHVRHKNRQETGMMQCEIAWKQKTIVILQRINEVIERFDPNIRQTGRSIA
jgi:hypothetical protein